MACCIDGLSISIACISDNGNRCAIMRAMSPHPVPMSSIVDGDCKRGVSVYDDRHPRRMASVPTFMDD